MALFIKYVVLDLSNLVQNISRRQADGKTGSGSCNIAYLPDRIWLLQTKMLRFLWDGHRHQRGRRRRRRRFGSFAISVDVGIVLPNVDDTIIASRGNEVGSRREISFIFHGRWMNEKERVYRSRMTCGMKEKDGFTS